MEKNTKFTYKNLSPFKWFVLENFPFLEADFDALTEWQLFCKLGKEINKIINSTNTLGIQVESLTDYVKNYFDNLDVQDEINNKLDEMAESGQLTEIIAQYLQLAGVLAYNTLNDLKQATNIVNGSICKTLGNINYNDGKGSFYKIRQITSKDVVDEENIISLNISNTLIAEKINNLDIINLKNDVDNLTNYNSKMLVIGDSWSDYNSQYFQNPNNLWCRVVAKELKLQLNLNSLGGSGFTVGTKTFLQLVNESINEINDPESYKYVIIYGGTNDVYNNSSSSVLSQINSACNDIIRALKNKFTNGTQIIIIGPNTREKITRGAYNNISEIDVQSYLAFSCETNGVTYIDGIPFMLNKNDRFTDNHPNDIGQLIVASNVLSCLKGNGILNSYTNTATYNLTGSSNISSAVANSKIYKDKLIVGVVFQTNTSGDLNISLNLSPFTRVPSQYLSIHKESDRSIVGGGQVTGDAFACYIPNAQANTSYRFNFEIPV